MENTEALKDYNSSLLSLVETYQEMCADLRGHIVRLERSNAQKRDKLWKISRHAERCLTMLLRESNTNAALMQTKDALREILCVPRDE